MITRSSLSSFVPAKVESPHGDQSNLTGQMRYRLLSCTKSIKNSPYLLGKLNKDAMHKIAEFCSNKDVGNMIMANLHPDMKSVYQHKITVQYPGIVENLHKWKNSAEGDLDDKKSRNIAVKQILDCIMYGNKDLDLSHLGLKSIPNLSSLNFITKLKWDGNDDSPIRDCFEITDNGLYRLKNETFLPDAIEHITISAECLVEKDMSLDFYRNDNFSGQEHIRQGMVAVHDDKIRYVYIKKYPITLNEDVQNVDRPPGKETARFAFFPSWFPIKNYYGLQLLELGG